jgi:Cu-Zn family superoxide dismutase
MTLIRKALGLSPILCLLTGCVVISDVESSKTVSATLEAPSFAPSNAPMVMTSIIEPGRKDIGQLTLKEGSGGVVVTLTASGISEGWHGMHFHVKGDCSDTAFKNSGGHINPSGREHGLQNPNGPDNADLPNIYADENGNVHAEMFTTRVSLIDGVPGRPNLLDSDGSALVIHANRDDHMSQPIGGAGPRIACATINN